jgi:hypothetical protein
MFRSWRRAVEEEHSAISGSAEHASLGRLDVFEPEDALVERSSAIKVGDRDGHDQASRSKRRGHFRAW